MSFLYYVISAGCLALAYRYKKIIFHFFVTLRYEIIYWALGGIAVGDDIIYSRNNKLKELPKRQGDIAVVTGGARGIGKEVVKKLLECDMTVVIACRNVNAGKKTVESIRNYGITSGNVDVLQLDVGSMASVRSFAEAFRAKFKKLNILFNNAGIMFAPFKLTEDGFEDHQATNYLGHFLLTHLLLEPLIAGGKESKRNSRVVNVSSCAHLPGSIHFKDFNYERSFYIPSQVYAQSKLAQIMFANAVERRLREKQLPVSMFSVHPGVVNTDLFDGTLLKSIAPWAPALMFKRPDQGAVSILHAGLSSDLEGRGGVYISNCRELWVSSTATNVEKQERLMKLSYDLLKIDNFGGLGE